MRLAWLLLWAWRGTAESAGRLSVSVWPAGGAAVEVGCGDAAFADWAPGGDVAGGTLRFACRPPTDDGPSRTRPSPAAEASPSGAEPVRALGGGRCRLEPFMAEGWAAFCRWPTGPPLAFRFRVRRLPGRGAAAQGPKDGDSKDGRPGHPGSPVGATSERRGQPLLRWARARRKREADLSAFRTPCAEPQNNDGGEACLDNRDRHEQLWVNVAAYRRFGLETSVWLITAHLVFLLFLLLGPVGALPLFQPYRPRPYTRP